ncbi:hypothetical protein P5673_012335 [Acropora cervicornis]|uniref:Uncharacterized protein n=1 Tax=Acropora cervicornis TaxID=6130 RepID=A0AAD9V7K0_ACRCE|nr:hypothetical protein P5673_012335 [Acropora cervicornis]
MSSPGNSKANGKVESAVKTAKNLLRKALSARTDPHIAILDYRNTPTQGMESSPAQRLMNRRTRTLLPTMKTLLQPRAPQSERDVQQLNRRQFQQCKYYNQHARDLPPLKEGDVVRMKPFHLGSKEWKKGTIASKLDERSYMVETPDGDTYRRNRYHLRFIQEKRHAIEEKLAEAADKRKALEDCYRRINEAASGNNLSSQRCSDCHYRNHTVPSCQMEKCESVFFCGELARHPDKKMKLQEQKNKIIALETSVTKLEQDLRSREAAFDRVHGSVKKLVEDMLLEEYPEEYVQNNSRNWLKIQQDIAFVKKSLQGNGPPRREIVKSLLETK